MSKTRNMPQLERVSIVIATVLMAIALSQIITGPGRLLPLDILGVFIPIEINFSTLVAVTIAGLTATGTDWILRDHPRLGERSTLPHWLLPALTAVIINTSLGTLPLGPVWWLAFAVGSLLLLVVLVAEYIAADLEDIRQPLASAGLNVLGFTIFLILAISLRASNIRLLVALPTLSISAGLISLRALHLRLLESWRVPQALISLVIIAQLSSVLHYLRLSPVGFGLILLGAVYAITAFMLNLEFDEDLRRAAIEPLSVMVILLLIALLLG